MMRRHLHSLADRWSARRLSAGRADGGRLPAAEALEARRLLSAAVSAAFIDLPSSLASGTSDRVTVRLTNTGDAPARGPFAVQLFATSATSATSASDGTPGPGSVLLSGSSPRLNLRPGASASVGLRFVPPASLASGAYDLVAQVSGTGIASSTITSPGPLAVQPAFINLAGAITQLPDRAVESGNHSKSSTVSIDVSNQGNVVARGKVSVVVYLSASGQLDADAIPVRVTIPRAVRLAPGQHVLVKARIRAPSGTTPGSYYLVAQVFGSHSISSREQGNSVTASASTVQVVPAPFRGPHGRGWYFAGGDFFPYDDGYYDYGYPVDALSLPIGYPASQPSGPIDTSGDSSGPTTAPPGDSLDPFSPGFDSSSSAVGASFGDGGGDFGGDGGDSGDSGGDGGSDGGGDSGGGDDGGD